MDDLLTPYLADPTIAAFANLFLSLIVLIWTLGIRERFEAAWKGWVGFWIGTSVFYACLMLSLPWEGVPFLALYAATWSLLLALLRCTTVTRPRLKATAIVGAAVVVDVLASWRGYEPALHQFVTAVVLAVWAWRIRDEPGESVALLAYAIVQLPLETMFWLAKQVASSPRVDAADTNYGGFIAATYVAYLVLKLTLIAPIFHAVKPPKNL